MSVIEDIGKELLRAAGPTVARGLVDLLRIAVRSKDPGVVARASLAEATKVAAELELRAEFELKKKAKAAVKKAVRP